MTKFEVGKVYTSRFISNSDSTIEVEVIKRTAKRLTIRTSEGVSTVGIRSYDDIEIAYPLGKYSMAPVIKSNRFK